MQTGQEEFAKHLASPIHKFGILHLLKENLSLRNPVQGHWRPLQAGSTASQKCVSTSRYLSLPPELTPVTAALQASPRLLSFCIVCSLLTKPSACGFLFLRMVRPVPSHPLPSTYKFS